VAYPEKILADDEQVVAHLHPHWITLVPATFWFIVICAAAGVGIAFAPSSGTGHTVVLILIIVVGLILLSWLSITPWISWKSAHYVFTTHRVLIRRGILRHTGRDIALQRISDVAFVQTLFDRMVGAGTLTIESAGEHGQESLENVPKADQQQQQLNRLIEQDGERRARLAYGGQQQYPPQQYGGQQQYPPQQYGGQQQYPPQQYPTQGYQGGYPQQQYPPQPPPQPPPQYPTQQYPPQS
jgi:membrane protein YdbS with pleckstrin-like domain